MPLAATGHNIGTSSSNPAITATGATGAALQATNNSSSNYTLDVTQQGSFGLGRFRQGSTDRLYILNNGEIRYTADVSSGYTDRSVPDVGFLNSRIIISAATTAQTTSTLNSSYPSAGIRTMVVAPSVGTGMVYIKVATSGTNQWVAMSTTNI